MNTPTVSQIRDEFIRDFDPTLDMNELIGSSFIADEDSIFLKPNADYIERELDWYGSQSLSVHDFPGGAPTIWKNVADVFGNINSNYGYLFWSEANGDQAGNVVHQLLTETETGRRATAVYTRPSIHSDYCRDDMQDFICTNAVCYYRRDGKIHAVVQMRSNDVVYGYRNDYAWQLNALKWVVQMFNFKSKYAQVKVGTITWQAGSLHVYPRHYPVIMKVYLRRMENLPKQETRFCERKTVIAVATKNGIQFVGRNGGPDRCLREQPGHEPAADYSDCPYPHAEINLFRDMLMTGVEPTGSALWITSPPCLDCVRAIVDWKPSYVVYGYRESVDGHLPMDDIHYELTEGGIKSWRVSLD